MECLEGKKKFLPIRILLPYDLSKVLRKKLSIYGPAKQLHELRGLRELHHVVHVVPRNCLVLSKIIQFFFVIKMTTKMH